MLDKACGVDVHRDTLVTTVLGDGWKETKGFENDVDGIGGLKAWLKGRGCGHMAMESSGVFWIPLYSALEEAGFEAVLANACQVKAIPGRKTDVKDSEWLAQLLRSGLIKPSYVPERRLRELRELTMLRVKLVDTRTAFKNRCHKVLNRVNIRLGSRLSDVFGKAGTEILEGLMEGKTLEAIIDQSRNKRLKRRRDEIVGVVKGSLSQEDCFILKECVDMVKHLDERIREVDARIQGLVNKEDVKIVATVPGVGKTTAASVTAEIGDPKRFESGKKVASWVGLAPSVYQSAGKTVTGRITKRGSKWLRRTMV